jgi:hypothetical protein
LPAQLAVGERRHAENSNIIDGATAASDAAHT